MSAVKRRDTKPELALRRRLHAMGLRFRVDVRTIPGRPDIVLPRYRTAVLVHGCFWHGHDCPLFILPSTRREFWLSKIDANQKRDSRNHELLLADGWRIATIWECSIRGRNAPGVEQTATNVAEFARSGRHREIQVQFDGLHLGGGSGRVRDLHPPAIEAD